VPEGLVAAGLVPFGSFSKPLRAALRQADKCWGDRPWRRETSQTTVPGANDSATIRALTASLQRRRRTGGDTSTACSIIYANRPLQDGTHIAGQLTGYKVWMENRFQAKGAPCQGSDALR
jgi:hypothetical protein